MCFSHRKKLKKLIKKSETLFFTMLASRIGINIAYLFLKNILKMFFEPKQFQHLCNLDGKSLAASYVGSVNPWYLNL